MAIGDFGDFLDSKTFAQYEGQPPILRKRTENVALLLSQGPGILTAHLRSIGIDNAGLITGTPLDFLTLPEGTSRDMGLLHWLHDVFVVYNNDHTAKLNLWTVGCDQDGEITDEKIDYLHPANATNATRRSDLFKPHDGILLTVLPRLVKRAVGFDRKGVDLRTGAVLSDEYREYGA